MYLINTAIKLIDAKKIFNKMSAYNSGKGKSKYRYRKRLQGLSQQQSINVPQASYKRNRNAVDERKPPQQRPCDIFTALLPLTSTPNIYSISIYLFIFCHIMLSTGNLFFIPTKNSKHVFYV